MGTSSGDRYPPGVCDTPPGALPQGMHARRPVLQVAVRKGPTPSGHPTQGSGRPCRSCCRVQRRVSERPRVFRRAAGARGSTGDPAGQRGAAMTGLLHEARETSGATTGGLLRYVRAVAGDDAVARVLERAGRAVHRRTARGPVALVELRHPHPAVRRGHRGSRRPPTDVPRSAPRPCRAGWRTRWCSCCGRWAPPARSSASCPAPSPSSAPPRRWRSWRPAPPRRPSATRCTRATAHSRLDCSYAQGLLSTVPTIFGLPAGAHRARRVRVRRSRRLRLRA